MQELEGSLAAEKGKVAENMSTVMFSAAFSFSAAKQPSSSCMHHDIQEQSLSADPSDCWTPDGTASE